MSDDRFKEARRSLIDDQEEDEEGTRDGAGREEDDEIAEAETQVVDLDSLTEQSGADDGQTASGGGPRRREEDRQGSRRGGSPNRSAEDGDRRRGDDSPDTLERDVSGRQQVTVGDGSVEPTDDTEEQEPVRPMNAPAGTSGRRQTRDPDRNSPQRRGGEPASGAQDGSVHDPKAETDPDVAITSSSDQPEQARGSQSLPPPTPDGAEPPPRRSSGGEPNRGGGDRPDGDQKVFVPGDRDASADEKTAFVNLNDFADAEPNSEKFTPDEQQAGYEGNTQLVDLEALTEDSGRRKRSVAIEDDEILQTAYDFRPRDIVRDDVNLIYAHNSAGEAVILRQVWSGDADAMPTGLRERINQLDELRVPNLITLNGMLIAESGAWVELDSPTGRRMSEILNTEGPQPPERVVGWIRSVGRGLATLHDHGLVYAHLTPDAVWIDEEDNAILEPFDVCALENRGDLGQFGPPEMNIHDDNRSLSPATDVYSLAAVTLAGITGIPLDPERVAAIESEAITRAVRDAVVDAPRERTQSVDRFVDQLGTGGESLFEGLHPAAIDFKVLLAITAALMGVTTGILYLVKGTSSSQPAPDRSGGAAAAGDETPAESEAAPADDPASAEDDGAEPDNEQEPAATAEAPGPVASDSRLTVETSYRSNPPLEADDHVDDLSGKLDELRQKAGQRRTTAEKLEATARKQKLRAALEAVTEAIRLQGDDVADEDLTLKSELQQTELMRNYRRKLVRGVYDNLKDGSIANARIQYQNLRAIDPTATAGSFFGTINSANVRRLEPIDETSSDQEADDAE